MNYILNPTMTGSTMLHAHGTYITEDALMRSNDLFLSEEYHENPVNGHISCNYRLCAAKPHTIAQALAYEIGCPHCHGKMRLVGACQSSHTLGLYACPNCNHE